MSLYYFDIEYNGGVHLDSTGAEFPDLDAALSSARLDALALAVDRLRFGQLVDDESIIIRDRDRNKVGKISVIDAVSSAIGRK